MKTWRSARLLLAGALIGTCGLLSAPQAGQAASLPTLDQLQCTGGYRSIGQVDYSDVRTFDTPGSIVRTYADSPEGAGMGLSMSYPPQVAFDNTSIARASKAIAAIDTRLGSPGLVMSFVKADNGDWRIDFVAECA